MIIKLLFISFFLSFSSSLFANSAPQITNLTTTVDLIENHRFVKRFRATDADGDSLTWSVDETFADSSNFTIDSDGKLFLNYTPDYEDSSQSRSLRVKIKVSDGAKTTSGKTSIKIKDAKSRQLVFNASPTTYIIMDGSTPANLMYDYETTTGDQYNTGEPISYDSINLNAGLEYGSYPYTLVSGFIGNFYDNYYGSGASMSNSYDDYLVSTSSADDPLFVRLEQPKANPDCGTNDYSDRYQYTPLCAVHIDIYRYDDDYGYYGYWKGISDGRKNKTIKLPASNKKYLIRVYAPSEMSNNGGASQYYLYAYRAGNTPGNVLNAFTMANSNSPKDFSWYKADLDLSNGDDWEYAENRILVYKKDQKTRKWLTKKPEFSEIFSFAEENILTKDGFSVIELDQGDLTTLSKPANSIIQSERHSLNKDSVNGKQPLSSLINSGITEMNTIENIVAILNRLYPNNEFSLDFKVQTHNFEYDPDYIRYQKEYFDDVKAEEGLNSIGTYDVKNVVVAVIDTGSPTKGSRAWESSNWTNYEYDFVSNDNDATDPSATMEYPSNGSHGTHVATTIAAKNDGKNINGFGLKVMPLRALDENGSGYSSDICNAIAYAGQVSNSTGEIAPRKAHVINMSLGGGSSCACQSVVDDVYNAGVVIVASAGNGIVQSNSYPASCENVLSVSSIGSNGQKAYYSNYGPMVDVSAPGGDTYLDEDGDGDWDGIWAFTKDNKLELYQGTSMAAPVASAVIGNVFAKNKRATPKYIDNLLKKRLIVSDMGNTGYDYVYGHGMVNLKKVAENSNAGAKQLKTLAEVVGSVTHLYDNGSGMVKIRKAGNGSMTVTDANTSHLGITITAFNVDSDGFGEYEINIDESRFNDNQGRFQEIVTFEVTDNHLTDIVSHPVIFEVGNISDARQPANLGRMIALALIDKGNELGQTIMLDLKRIEGESTFSHLIEEAEYDYNLSTDSDHDFYVCDFGEICWENPALKVNSKTIIDATISGNVTSEISNLKDRSAIGKIYRRD
tara:strand:+ start:2396 stop:5437 length:3042 start_codon:yes stop_codon:yes gene_type:complete